MSAFSNAGHVSALTILASAAHANSSSTCPSVVTVALVARPSTPQNFAASDAPSSSSRPSAAASSSQVSAAGLVSTAVVASAGVVAAVSHKEEDTEDDDDDDSGDGDDGNDGDDVWLVESDVLLLMSTADVLPRDSHCFHCTGSASVEQPLFVTPGQSGDRT